jgi:purine-binding chemotaxis protein CheW
MSSRALATKENAEEFIVFTLGDEPYASALSSVSEVVRPGFITRVPGARPDILGITSVRGRIVTVVDLSLSLGVARKQSRLTERLIVAEYNDEAVGFLVDEIREVVRLPESAMEEASILGTQEKAYLRGIARNDHEVIVLINIDALSPLRADENANSKGAGRDEGANP